MKTWATIAALAAACLLATGAYFLLFSGGEPVQAARVQRGEVREFVDEQGKTRLPETYRITMPYPARIEAIALVEGQQVSAGQVVAQINAADLQHDVDEAQAVVDRFEASIKENRDNSVENRTREQAEKFVESMAATVAAADARRTSGKARLDYAENYFADIKKLFQKGAKSEDEANRAEVDYIEAQVNYKQDVLVWEAMKSIFAATALVPKVIDDYVSRKDLSRAVLEKQRSEAQARLDQMLTKQARGTMTSPVSGVVLNRPITNERFLAAETLLLEIGELSKLELEADILSQDVVRIQAGDEVEIYGPAVGAEEGSGVAGRVSRIYPAGFTKISSLGVEQQRVKVIVQFAAGEFSRLRAQRELGVDYRVRVRIFTSTKADTTFVPRSALFRGADGGWQVFAIRSQRARLQPVDVGLMNDEQAEITGGLEPDELVILAPESSLADGDKVQPVLRNGF